MILFRAPVRISFGGGGTDFPSYYSRYGGFLIAAAIDKYIYIAVNQRFSPDIRLSYSRTEIVPTPDKVEHRLAREALKLLEVEKHVEIVSVSDVPANCGLGTSGAFMVALLGALHEHKGGGVTPRRLAEEASAIEIERLGDPVGKQDQYISAFGGITCLTFEKSGRIAVEPLAAPDGVHAAIEKNLLLFYTGIERNAAEILAKQEEQFRRDDAAVVDALHEIKEIGLVMRTALERGDLAQFGEMLDRHWHAKKKLSGAVTTPFIDDCYETAKKNGARGGKIIGAGGGGFFMFYCPEKKTRLRKAMEEKGLVPMPFTLDFTGARLVYDEEMSR